MQNEYDIPDGQKFIVVDGGDESKKSQLQGLDEFANALFRHDATWIVGAGYTDTSRWVSFEFSNSVGPNTLIIHHPPTPVQTPEEFTVADHFDDLRVEIIGKVLDNANEIVDISYSGTLRDYYINRISYLEFSKLDRLMGMFIQHPEVAATWLSNESLITYNVMGVMAPEGNKVYYISGMTVCLFSVKDNPRDNVLLVDFAESHLDEHLTNENINNGLLSVAFGGIRITVSPKGFGTFVDTALKLYHKKLMDNYQGNDLTYVGISDYFNMFTSEDITVNPIYRLGAHFAYARSLPTDINEVRRTMDIADEKS